MEVHKTLGNGFSEIVYKDALEYEFKKHSVHYEREREFCIAYKEIILPRKFNVDFTAYGKIILEIKAVDSIHDSFIGQTINYLKASKNKLGILINFGESSLKYKRIVL